MGSVEPNPPHGDGAPVAGDGLLEALGIDAHVLEAELAHGLPQKETTAETGLEKGPREPGPHDREGQPRTPAAGADIEGASGNGEPARRRERLREIAEDSLPLRLEANQIELRGPPGEDAVERLELRVRFGIEGGRARTSEREAQLLVEAHAGSKLKRGE